MVRTSTYFGLLQDCSQSLFFFVPQEKARVLLTEVETLFPTGESWLGLDALHNLTENTNNSYNLKIILTDRSGTIFFAIWDWIKVIVFKEK